jgi:hypothetical protein
MIARILAWCDDFHRQTGRWPRMSDGLIPGELEETWRRVDNALRLGPRGLKGGSSLADLLAGRRGVRNVRRLPILTEEEILRWAREHHRRTGTWPNEHSGPIAGTKGEVWQNVNAALREGGRSLRGGTTVAGLLADRLGVRTRAAVPALSIPQILAWADAHQARTCQWPRATDGAIADAPGETWEAIDAALRLGNRGLTERSSLAKLLAERRGARNRADLPLLTEAQIVAWAEEHHQRTGRWPACEADPIAASEETWLGVNLALYEGMRGLAGGSSLSKLLAERAGAPIGARKPRLAIPQIVAWAKLHRERTGRWPTQLDGDVADALGERWRSIHQALYRGYRGLPGGMTLPALLRAFLS